MQEGLLQRIVLSPKNTRKKNVETNLESLELLMGGNNRTDLQIGSRVRVVQKENQKSGILTEGVVTAILTKSAFHPHGIKVRLDNGSVGRVKNII